MMTFDALKQILLDHRLVSEKRNGSLPDTLKCACGLPCLREEQWARHVAELIKLELLDD